MPRIVKDGRVQRRGRPASKPKLQQQRSICSFFRTRSDPSTDGYPAANILGVHKTLLPAFASTMSWGGDRVPRPPVCPCCKVKPCLMLSHKTEIHGVADLWADRVDSAYYLRINMLKYTKKKVEELFQKPLDSLPECFEAYLEKWFPDDVATSDEEEELDADEEITT